MLSALTHVHQHKSQTGLPESPTVQEGSLKSPSRILPARPHFCENPGLFPVERQSQERKDDQEPLCCVRCEHHSLSKLQASGLRGPLEARSRELGNVEDRPASPSREEAGGSRYLRAGRAECQHAREWRGQTPEPPQSSDPIANEGRPAGQWGLGAWAPKTLCGFWHPPGLGSNHGTHLHTQ